MNPEFRYGDSVGPQPGAGGSQGARTFQGLEVAGMAPPRTLAGGVPGALSQLNEAIARVENVAEKLDVVTHSVRMGRDPHDSRDRVAKGQEQPGRDVDASPLEHALLDFESRLMSVVNRAEAIVVATARLHTL